MAARRWLSRSTSTGTSVAAHAWFRLDWPTLEITPAVVSRSRAACSRCRRSSSARRPTCGVRPPGPPGARIFPRTLRAHDRDLHAAREEATGRRQLAPRPRSHSSCPAAARRLRRSAVAKGRGRILRHGCRPGGCIPTTDWPRGTGSPNGPRGAGSTNLNPIDSAQVERTPQLSPVQAGMLMG